MFYSTVKLKVQSKSTYIHYPDVNEDEISHLESTLPSVIKCHSNQQNQLYKISKIISQKIIWVHDMRRESEKVLAGGVCGAEVGRSWFHPSGRTVFARFFEIKCSHQCSHVRIL